MYANFCIILILFVLRSFCRIYYQKFTQHHNTTTATTNKREGVALVILLTLLSDNIPQHCFYLQLLFINNCYIQNLQELQTT